MDCTVLVCIILKTAELSFIYKPLNEFWLGIKTEFPVIPKMILNLLLLFYATYLYEVKFLTSMNDYKTKILRNVEDIFLCPSVSNIHLI